MKNKILTISIIFILLSFIFINSCFAYSYSNSISTLFNACVDYLEENGLSYYNYVIFEKKNANEYLFYFNVKEWGGGRVNSSNNYFQGTAYCIFWFSEEDKDISFYANKPTVGTWTDLISLSLFEITYSNYDVETSSGTLFFQRTPAPTTLAAALEIAKPKETFQTMMSGIILYLIALVVGLVAFWKAWQLLLKELRKV